MTPHTIIKYTIYTTTYRRDIDVSDETGFAQAKSA